jgi:hypothetical protein
MSVDPAPNSKRTLIRSTAAGVLLSAVTTAATFTTAGSEFAFLRYPLLGAAVATVVLAGWNTGRLPAFNRTLWAHAPWWARLLWLAITQSSDSQEVLETRGIAAVAAYLFLIAGLRGNVDDCLADDDPFEHPAAVMDERDARKRRSRRRPG